VLVNVVGCYGGRSYGQNQALIWFFNVSVIIVIFIYFYLCVFVVI